MVPRRLSVSLTEEQWLRVLNGLRSQSSWLLKYRSRSRKLQVLKAIDEAQGRFSELHREDVAPLRPAGHATPPDRAQ